MWLDDIQKSARKMTQEELRAKIEEIRRGRVQTVKQVEKTHRTTKTTTKNNVIALAKKLGLTKEQLLELIEDGAES